MTMKNNKYLKAGILDLTLAGIFMALCIVFLIVYLGCLSEEMFEGILAIPNIAYSLIISIVFIYRGILNFIKYKNGGRT